MTERDNGPDALLDAVSIHLGLKHDAALARALEVLPSCISKIRNRRSSVTADLLIRMHEETDLPIKTLKSILAGDGVHCSTAPFEKAFSDLQAGSSYRITTKDWTSPVNEVVVNAGSSGI
jgi:hypothetical protein